MKTNRQKLEFEVKKAYKNPYFKGKEVIFIGNEVRVLSTNNKNARSQLLISLSKKYPQQIPLITLIPKENTLILILD